MAGRVGVLGEAEGDLSVVAHGDPDTLLRGVAAVQPEGAAAVGAHLVAAGAELPGPARPGAAHVPDLDQHGVGGGGSQDRVAVLEGAGAPRPRTAPARMPLAATDRSGLTGRSPR
ncbi:hypothetical protein [Streptomyces sp. KM273126]|uniref:hypothetical protein n=1 Tax=Streptomyces sp. KM273126 TaxID=2545247 RepID=UPI00215DB26A|nr:hypothetical protein [Streptomyces sp. KM273126]